MLDANRHRRQPVGAKMAMIKWLMAAGAVMLLALAAFPVAVDAWNGWIRPAHVQSIQYLPRDINDLSASRRRNHRRDSAPLQGEGPG